MKTTWQKIKSPTPQKNKIRGRITTAIGGTCFTLFSVGIFSSNQYVHYGLLIASCVLGFTSWKDALKYKR